MSRPTGLRREQATGPWWRIDATHPDDWDWDPFPTPRQRFDPSDGSRRVRYAGRRPVTAAYERLWPRHVPAIGRPVVTRGDLDLWLVRLDGSGPTTLSLTRQVNLTAIGLDDRISTARLFGGDDPHLQQCWDLGAAVARWWPDQPTAIRYRSRVLPSSTNLAFPAWDGEVEARRLGDATRLLATLSLHHGFRIPHRQRQPPPSSTTSHA